MYLSEQIASFIVKVSLGSVPYHVRSIAKNSIMDCLGVTVAGSKEPASELITEFVKSQNCSGESSIIAKGIKVSPTGAALANATMAHTLDFDDCSDTIGGHPSVVILPPVLAIGQSLRSTGRQVLEAYITGFEIEANLAKLVNFEHYYKGWHPTATLGVFGSTGACAKLLKLDIENTAVAISIAASMAAGIKENFGTMTKPLHAGFASRNGLTAAILAKSGFTAKKSALEGKQGFFEVYNGPGKYRIENLEQFFGNPWDLEDPGVAIKQYPCCGATHSAIDAVANLVKKFDLRPQHIHKIKAAIHPHRLSYTNRPLPTSSIEAKFSLQYAIALMAVNKSVTLNDFSEKALQAEAVLKMLSKVEAAPLSEDKWGPEHFAAEVDITCTDGRRLHERVEKAKGRGPKLALSDEELERKFINCVKLVFSSEKAESILAMVKDIEKLEDIGILMDNL